MNLCNSDFGSLFNEQFTSQTKFGFVKVKMCEVVEGPLLPRCLLEDAGGFEEIQNESPLDAFNRSAFIL